MTDSTPQIHYFHKEVYLLLRVSSINTGSVLIREFLSGLCTMVHHESMSLS